MYGNNLERFSPTNATVGDLYRYAISPTISDFDFSFLIYGILPRHDSEFIFMMPEYAEVQEFLKFLRKNSSKINNLSSENKRNHAPFKEWVIFLQVIEHPIPEEMLIMLEELRIKEKEDSEKSEQLLIEFMGKGEIDLAKNLDSKNVSDLEKELKYKLEILVSVFHDMPTRHYMKHPSIRPLIVALNWDDEKFYNFASEVYLQPKKPGRPKKDYLIKYEHAHQSKEMQLWFKEIENS
jgi:hypothetical protein